MALQVNILVLKWTMIRHPSLIRINLRTAL